MTDITYDMPLGGAWKRKRYFDGTTCGMKDCTHQADGYICDTKPTKDGVNGRLWFGPACQKCVSKTHPSLRPMTLAELAHQRNGASDLALVLDVEVGDVLGRLKLAGLDEKGRKLASSTVEPAAETTSSIVVAAEAVAIPVQHITAKLDEAKHMLSMIQVFQITSQETLDMAGEMTKMVKTAYNEIEEARKAIVRPLRFKIAEIQNYFLPPLNLLEEAEKVLKEKISDAVKRANTAQQQALEMARAAFQQGQPQATAQATQLAAQNEVVLPQGVTVRKLVRWAIQDPNMVPAQLWSPDVHKIQAAIDAGYRQIPGVSIWEEDSVAVRR